MTQINLQKTGSKYFLNTGAHTIERRDEKEKLKEIKRREKKERDGRNKARGLKIRVEMFIKINKYLNSKSLVMLFHKYLFG